jgi:hypothetical protein
MVDALLVSTSSCLGRRDSSRSTAYMIVSTKYMTASPRPKKPCSTRAFRGINGLSSSSVLAHQMLFTFQGEPVNQGCRWVVGLGERAGNIVVWREKADTKAGDIVVLLGGELSGIQEHLLSQGCGNVVWSARFKVFVCLSNCCRCGGAAILCTGNGVSRQYESTKIEKTYMVRGRRV